MDNKSNRLEAFFEHLRADGYSDYEIMAGIDNGDIDQPDWMSIEVGRDYLKAWDESDSGSRQMGFYTLNC